ncbi:MAG: HMA2 domain-containing protein [Thermodesulfobacteriota bacterium]
MTTEGLKVVHALPGRVRLKMAAVKGHDEVARQIQQKLAAVPGIRQVEANPVSGSLLVHYDQEALQTAEALEPLAGILEEFCPEVEALSLLSRLSALAAMTESGPGAGARLTAGIQTLNTQLGKLTGGLDLKVLAPLALFLFGLRGLLFGKKKVFPAWHDYFWFAFSTFVMLNRNLFEEYHVKDGDSTKREEP